MSITALRGIASAYAFTNTAGDCGDFTFPTGCIRTKLCRCNPHACKCQMPQFPSRLARDLITDWRLSLWQAAHKALHKTNTAGDCLARMALVSANHNPHAC